MKKVTMNTLFLCMLTPFVVEAAGVTEAEMYIQNAKSVKAVKTSIRQALVEMEECGSGGCINNYSTEICNLVAALDTQVGGQIIGDNPSDPTIKIIPEDLKLMKLIFSQCKPTNYYYWNLESILHVWYRPTAEVNSTVRKALGLKAGK